MKLLLALTIIACACAAHAAITTRVNILTENKFEALNPEWVRGEPAAPNDLVNFRLYLWQQNRDELDRVFNDITNPYSPNYGQWMSKDEILDIVSAPAGVRDSIMEFLRFHGVERIVDGGDVIKCTARVEAAEAVFDTTFFEFINPESQRRIIRQVAGYSLPVGVVDHVQLVTGITAFPPPPKTRIGRTGDVTPDEDQNGKIVPYTIDMLYGIPENGTMTLNDNSSVCLAEFQNDRSFNADDLTVFQQQNDLPVVAVANIVGPYEPSQPDAEATLDTQYGSAIALNASVWYWTVDGWMLEFANQFFDTDVVPYVVSMSWGWPEDSQCQITNCGSLTSEEYVSRTNTEWQKIGARGVTLLASSGDQGAPGDNNPLCSNSAEPVSTIFPGASPYVTSVGATMLVPPSSDAEPADADAPPICSDYDCADPTWPEQACTIPEALITSGGGFSDYSDRASTASWQDKVVSNYLSDATVQSSLPEAANFNSTNRGFPDISAVGHNYMIYLNGRWSLVDGTSCSSPVIGGMVALWNDWLLNNGFTTLGFLNPTLYAMYEADNTSFKDITVGNNNCTESLCCNQGYPTATGWDAVTGLGAPVYSKMLSFIQNNPPGSSRVG